MCNVLHPKARELALARQAAHPQAGLRKKGPHPGSHLPLERIGPVCARCGIRGLQAFGNVFEHVPDLALQTP